MKKIALIGIFVALTFWLSGCVVVSWEERGHRRRACYVSGRAGNLVKVVHVPGPDPRRDGPDRPRAIRVLD